MVILNAVAATFFLAKPTTSPSTHSSADSSKKQPLVITGARGGMCPDGPCGGDSETVYIDGASSGGNLTLPSSDVEKIESLIAEFDLSTYSTDRDCGSSIMDGQDPYLKFPAKYGDKEFEACGVKSSESNQIADIFATLRKYWTE